MPNNALTTWECMGYKSGGKVKLNTKEAKEAKDSLHRVRTLFQKQISRTFPELFQDSD